MTLKKKPFENIVGKGENAGNQHFLLFLQCFLPIPKTIFVFKLNFILSSANAFNLEQSKICRLGKELNHINPFAVIFAFKAYVNQDQTAKKCAVWYLIDTVRFLEKLQTKAIIILQEDGPYLSI